MAKVTKRTLPSGLVRWQASYVDGDAGKRRAKLFARKGDGEAWLVKVSHDLSRGLHTPASTSPTVAEAAEQWLTHVRAEGRERGTLEGYRQLVTLHISPELGRLKLSALSAPRINAFRDDLLAKRGLSRLLARKILGSLKMLLKDAMRRGNVAQNVALGVSVQLSSRGKRRLRVGEDVPTPEEVRRMIEAAHGQQRAFLITACFTGLRSSELRGLRWSDVELEGAKPQLHVRQRADRYRQMGNLKSASGERSIPLGPFVANSLKSLRALERRGELVFANQAGNIAFHQDLVSRMLHRAQLAGGITIERDGKLKAKYTGLHCLHHFFASWCINRRVDGGLELPLKTVQSRLGHATLAMTADVYGHLFPSSGAHDELAEAEARLGLHVA